MTSDTLWILFGALAVAILIWLVDGRSGPK